MDFVCDPIVDVRRSASPPKYCARVVLAPLHIRSLPFCHIFSTSDRGSQNISKTFYFFGDYLIFDNLVKFKRLRHSYFKRSNQDSNIFPISWVVLVEWFSSYKRTRTYLIYSNKIIIELLELSWWKVLDVSNRSFYFGYQKIDSREQQLDIYDSDMLCYGADNMNRSYSNQQYIPPYTGLI